jgi:zinc protease
MPNTSIPGPESIVRHEFDNGIIALVRENFSSPSVVVEGALQAGSLDEADERAGLAGFVAEALTRGTQRRTFAQIYEEVESIGASFGIDGGRHSSGFGAKGLAEDLWTLLDIIADVLRNPTFPAEEIEKVRGEIMTDFQIRAHDTRRLAGLEFRALMYPNHPYGRSPEGYPETVKPITRDDLADFHRAYYGPQGMIVSVVGAVKAEQVLELLGRALGDWKAERPERSELPPVAPITTIREKRIPMPGKIQSDIVMGWVGPPRKEPNYLDVALANTILGIFGMYGRLGDNVRDKQGLAYYSYSRLEGGLGPGPWTAIAGVNPANVERAVSSIRDEIRQMQDEPVGEEELADNKAYLTGSLPLRLETNEGVAQSLLDMERYGLGLDYLQRYSGLINEITPQRIQAAAQRYLNADAYALAVAGPEAVASSQ